MLRAGMEASLLSLQEMRMTVAAGLEVSSTRAIRERYIHY
jgi:hypothetical protein